MKKKGIPIFYQLLISFLVVTAVIGSALTFIFYSFSNRNAKKRIKKEIYYKLDEIKYNFDTYLIKELEKDLKVLASHPLLNIGG